MVSVEDSEDSAGDVALQTASDFSVGFLFGLSFLNIGAGFSIVGHLADGHYMQGTVQGSVATAVETMAHGVAR